MNVSKTLRKFLHTGSRPASQRESGALLDEARSLLVSKLPTTDETIQNFSETELASVNLKGGNVLDKMHKVYLEKQNYTPSNTPSKMKVFTSPPPAKKSATPAARPAPAPVATSKPAPIKSMSNNPSSNTPSLDTFEKLDGPAAAAYYAKHGTAIRAEAAARQHDRVQLEREMNTVRATSKQREQLKKTNR